MARLNSTQLRRAYIDFFISKGHKEISYASLIPDNDPTVLFTTAGMHPLVPYLLGEKHPAGKRLTNVQKCVRTGDIDEVGNSTHCTFFEMLGNWSLGDYFKVDSIKYSFEFLTKHLKIPIDRLAITCFAGDENAPKDMTSYEVWRECGIPNDRIYFLPKEDNWWGPAGATGPCGPDTEIFYINDMNECSPSCQPGCNCGKYVEIWNNVFMEYDKQPDGTYIPLTQKNVDTGMGLERTITVLNNLESVYCTDVFIDVMTLLTTASGKDDKYLKEKRIICDHIRTATFMLGDEKGIPPSNVDQGYVLRRLIRRAVRYARVLEMDNSVLIDASKIFIQKYGDTYKELLHNKTKIIDELSKEIARFNKTLTQGLKEFHKLLGYIKNNRMSGKAAFRLYDTFGFPIEMTLELARDNGIIIDMAGFDRAFKEHQEKSKAGAAQRFKGGLADNTDTTARLHTATHILLSALKTVLGDNSIQQKGSNITPERLRFDFNFPRPLTAEEKAEVEAYVNKVIDESIDIECKEYTLEEAMKLGAEGVFGDRYSERVKVYKIGDYSMEICGGPHVNNTKELKEFKIIKEQSSSSGIRRIRAILL